MKPSIAHLKKLSIPAFWTCTHKKRPAALSFAVGRACSAQACPAAGLNRCFDHSPVDALIDIKFGCRLRHQIPVRLDLRPVIRLSTTVVPQRRPTCRGDVG